MKRAILVNGLPASGKSTIARRLAARHGFALLTLDSIKEPFFDAVGIGDREHNRRLGRAAMAALWRIVGDGPEGAGFVLDAWFGVVPRETLLDLAGRSGARTAEIWCHAPGEVLAARYVARAAVRHPGHPGAEYADELARRAGEVAPVAIGPVFGLATEAPADEAALDRFLAAAFA